MNGLKFIRSYLYMSSEALANKLGVSRALVSMWENMQKPIPPKRLKELSDIFGLDVKYFGEISEEQQEEIKEMSCYYNKEDDAYTFNRDRASYIVAFSRLPSADDMELDTDEFHNDSEFKKELNEYLQILKQDISKENDIYGIKMNLRHSRSILSLYQEFTTLMNTCSNESVINYQMIMLVIRSLEKVFGIENKSSNKVYEPLVEELSETLLEHAKQILNERYHRMAKQNTESVYFEKLNGNISRDKYIEDYVNVHIEKSMKQMNVKTRKLKYESLEEKEREIDELNKRIMEKERNNSVID